MIHENHRPEQTAGHRTPPPLLATVSHAAGCRADALRRLALKAMLLTSISLATASGQATPALPLANFGNREVMRQCVPSCDQVTIARATEPAAGLQVSIAAGQAGYPGILIKPAATAKWNLSDFGHIEARVVNTSDQALSVNLRVDNAGDWQDNPWNCESLYLKPRESGTVKVIFGYQYGYKPGHKLDPSNVVQVLLFTGRVTQPASFRIESLAAAGPAREVPPVKPEDVRLKPVDGYILGGGGLTIDAAKQLDAKDGAHAEVARGDAGDRLLLTFDAGRNAHDVLFRPPVGRWDFTQSCELRFRVRNVGDRPLVPAAQARSDWHNGTDLISADAPLAPGNTLELVVPFAPATPWQGPTTTITRAYATGTPGTGTTFAADRADAVRFAVTHTGNAALLVETVKATVTPVALPAWSGTRPPVDGEWTLTFEDSFDGDTVNRDRWNIYTENYWDKRSHFTKDNVILGNGMVRLHMEKKRGHENDDPKRKQTDYAVGFLDTYGKWTQRYGYFEARMKLPTAPGLWPAFWMMPDRGPDTGAQWKRADTGNGGMEFDIMEHLTRWGPYRYNIAMHWDGYEKEHKSLGSSNIYTQPDPRGFLTCGLLWTPGTVVYYCNGRVVARWESPRVSTVPAYPILYMVTGGWDNSPLDDARLPDDFVIDYIRVWQRKDLAEMP